MNFTKQEIKQIEDLEISLSDIEQQIKNFGEGFDFARLQRPATINDGIKIFSTEEIENLITLYGKEKHGLSIMKFVPSSGAATRMMKDLYSFINEYKDEETTPIETFPSAYEVITHIKDFAFYSLLKEKIKQEGLSIEEILTAKDYKTLINFILSQRGLTYGKSPKAWILFHKKEDRAITPFEEHILEATEYCNNNGEAKIEFSILEEHRQGFEELKKQLLPFYENKYNIKYNISFSYQKHSTDTIAVDLNNKPVHTKENKLLFRPSGHGALIENLHNLNADIIFIKNIDNVCSKYRKDTYKYKKFLGGVLIWARQQIFSLQEKLKKENIDKQELVSIYEILKKQIGFVELKSFTDFENLSLYKSYLRDFLNRPLRVCGMVKNEGEVGGGPFFVEKNGEISLHIVEKAQVNLKDEKQKDIFTKATHFNPVDLVISTTKANGEKYNLQSYIDKKAGFISEKSFEGQIIKAQERPGLWNGAMSDWLSIFVQVPLTTFNPVKTITDLLKESHR